MTKRSTATVRQQAAREWAEAAGTLRVYSQAVTVDTLERLQLVDVTEQVAGVVRESGVGEGLVNVWSMHTTAAIMISEYQRALLADITRLLHELVERDGGWKHDDSTFSDCDRANADSHLRAMLLGHTVTLQVSGGEPVLGQWQRVLLAELDGPRSRTLRIQVSGV